MGVRGLGSSHDGACSSIGQPASYLPRSRRASRFTAVALAIALPFTLTACERVATHDTGNSSEYDAVEQPPTKADTYTIVQDASSGEKVPAYSGSWKAKAHYDGNTSGASYARGVFNTAQQNGAEGYYGAAFYFPPGTLYGSAPTPKLTGNLDILGWTNTLGQFGGIRISGSDHSAHLIREGPANPQDNIGSAFNLEEGCWNWLTVHQKLSGQSGTINQVFLNGTKVVDSTQPSSYGATVDQIKFGMVKLQLPAQSQKLDFYVDNAFASDSANRDPSVHACQPRTGARPYYSFESQELTDRMDANVNVASGNLMLHQTDLGIAGTGLDLGVDRYYNSQNTESTKMGTGWTSSAGADVSVQDGPDGSKVYRDASGAQMSFESASGNWKATSGLNASIAVTGWTGNQTMSLHRSGTTLHFDHPQGFTKGGLMSAVDQNNNTITNNYQASSNRLDKITDTQGRETTVTTQANGKIEKITDPSSSPLPSRVYDYVYDGSELDKYIGPGGATTDTTDYTYTSGRLTKITDPKGNVTQITYESTYPYRVKTIKRVTASTSEPDPTTTFTYNSGGSCATNEGRTVVTDPEGHNTIYCWETGDRVTKVRDANNRTRSTSYNSNSEVNSYTTPSYGTLNVSASFVSNDDNSLRDITVPTGSGTQLTSHFGYDTPEDYAHNFRRFYPASYTNEQGNTTSYGYDDKGNVKSVSDQASGAITLDRDPAVDPHGQITKATDGNGHSTNYRYDPNGNLTSITPPTVTSGTQPGPTIITYDALSRVKTVKDGKLQIKTYDYDVFDRVTRISFDDGSSTEYSYDDNGNTSTRVDMAGTTTKTTDYDYDELNRLKEEGFPNGTHNHYGYDKVGNLVSFDDGDGTTAYGYDPGNRVTTVREPLGDCAANDRCTKYAYTDNMDGTATIMKTLPTGPAVVETTTLDAAGRVKSVATKKDAANLASFSYSYTRPTGCGATSDTSLIHSVSYSSDSASAYSANYCYDPRDRLRSASTNPLGGGYSYTYHYDDASNLGLRTGGPAPRSYSYNEANQLTSVSGGSGPDVGTYTYDANGNQLGNATSGLVLNYNAADQTTKAAITGGPSANSIGYFGPNQIDRSSADGTTFKQSAFGLRMQDPAPGISEAAYFLRDPEGGLIGARREGHIRYYYLFDGLGSVVGLVSEGGTLQRSYRYDPFGNLITDTDHTTYQTAPVDYNRFTGGFQDGGGLYHFGMRYYDPRVGRWTQQDPISSPGDLQEGNRYVYVGDDPVDLADPAGMDIIHDVWNKAKSTYNSIRNRPAVRRAGKIGKALGLKKKLTYLGRCANALDKRNTLDWGNTGECDPYPLIPFLGTEPEPAY
jgi:RHS repeat-associated protein